MKKTLAFFALFALFSVGHSAALGEESTAICAPSVPFAEREPDMNLWWGSNCECWQATPDETAWRQLFCLDGKMLEQRTVEDLVKPFCLQKYVRYEDRLSPNVLCRACTNPTGYSEWKVVGCMQAGVVKTRTAFNSCVFDSMTSGRTYADKTVFRFFPGERCGAIESMWQAPAAIAVILLVAFIVLKKKKVV